jgi:hypothetical protein
VCAKEGEGCQPKKSRRSSMDEQPNYRLREKENQKLGLSPSTTIKPLPRKLLF